MRRQYVQNLSLPDRSGVYIFKDYKKKPLYIGRATSLRDRVRSYFSDDIIKTRGPRIVDMITKARSLDYVTTDSVLEAIISESDLIKKYQPIYNVEEKDDKSSQYVIITDEPWPRVFLVRVRDFEEMKSHGTLPYKVKSVFGPYIYGSLMKDALRILRKLFPFKDERSRDVRHDLFYKSIGRSPHDDDVGDSANLQSYDQTIKYLTMFFQGRKRQLRNKVMKDMNSEALALRFEKANELKRLLYAMDHIDDVSLIKHGDANNDLGHDDFRMEAYDVAHLSGTNVVGVMVVSMGGDKSPSQYRKFILRRQTNDDTASLAEILLRRLNHTEWPYPDLIIVDGNDAQMGVANNILKSRRLNIPVVAVTKDDKHRAKMIMGDGQIIGKFEKPIMSLNAEAHRFAITFHRKRRAKSNLI